MLTMADIKYIKDLSDKKGLSLREISRTTGFNFRTVKKYVDREDWSEPLTRKNKSISVLDPFVKTIDEWLEADFNAPRKQRHSAKRIYNRLKRLCKDDFTVSYRTVARYVAEKKRQIYGSNEGFIPLYHPAGEAQLDFGMAEFVENGIRYEGCYVAMSFPYSNGGYIQAYKGTNIECLLQGMQDIFNHMGQVPTCIWFDNDKAIVKKILTNGEREVTNAFNRFRMHYGFESNFCNPDSGHEKGHVENKVGYSRRNMLVPVPEFKDLQKFNKSLLTECDEDMQRNHYSKDVLIAILFEQDKKAMRPLPRTEYEIYRLEKVKADKYGKVNFDNRKYSVSPEHAQRELFVKVNAFSVLILDDQYHVVQHHNRLYGKQKESMKWEPYLILMGNRPNAIKYTGFFQQLPQTLQDYLSGCDYEQKKAALRILKKMVANSELETAVKAFNFCIEKGIRDMDSIWASYYSTVFANAPIPDIVVKDEIPCLSYGVDNSIYDSLLKGGLPHA